MRKGLLRATTAVAVLGLGAMSTAPANAVEQNGVNLNFLLQGKFQPTWFSNFDLDSDRDDTPTATSAGSVDVGDEHVRSEIRYGIIAQGDKWTGKLIFENDLELDANTADRIFRGERFGIERAYFTYEFDPALVLQAGHEFKTLDIGTGGLLFGDDYPVFGFKGDLGGGMSYDLFWMNVISGGATADAIQPGQVDATDVSNGDFDANVFAGKFNYALGNGRVSPIIAHQRNNEFDNNVTWFGGEYIGSFGNITIRAEGFTAQGDFSDGDMSGAFNANGVNAPAGAANLEGDDISSFAGFLSAEAKLTDSFQPYGAFRWMSGDSDPFDDDVGGWLGITDISRFSPVDGINGQFLGFNPTSNAAIGSMLFGTAFDQAGPARTATITRRGGLNGANYGGIQNSGTGLNPGQIRMTLGASGTLTAISPKMSYKAQAAALWFEDTAGLEVLPGADNDVSNFAGIETTGTLRYKWSSAFTTRATLSVFNPGQGVEDATGADDMGGLGVVELLWSF